jgi:hypothetical protein
VMRTSTTLKKIELKFRYGKDETKCRIYTRPPSNPLLKSLKIRALIDVPE